MLIFFSISSIKIVCYIINKSNNTLYKNCGSISRDFEPSMVSQMSSIIYFEPVIEFVFKFWLVLELKTMFRFMSRKTN